MDLRAKTCCFTGHRNLSSGEKLKAAVRLREIIAEQIKAGVVFYGAGGALGFDTLAAQTVLDMKKEYPQDYGWAKNAQCFASLKPKASVTFEMIRGQCTTITEDWKKAYKESCQVVHASPLGTLGRMGSPNENRVISTGSSDYGLAPPAVNSAISLMHVTLFYFGLLSQMDSRAMIRTIQKWLDNLIDCYTSINSRSFSLEEISDNLPQTYE